MNEIKLKLTGTNTLLMANGRMADPHDEYALAYALHNTRKPSVRSKAVKKDLSVMSDWLEEERRLQFYGLLYWDAALGFHIPADNLLYMVREAFFGYGSTSLGGDRLLSVLRTDKEAYPLEYEGPRTPDERWQEKLYRTGRVANRAMGGAKVRVLQPLFNGWSVEFTLSWKEEALLPDFLGRGKHFDRERLVELIRHQGNTFGLGAYRKSGNFGNFTLKVQGPA